MGGYQALRAELVHMQAQQEARLEKITRDLHHTDEPPEKDFAEQVTERENDEVLASLAVASRDELRLIRQAIRRIDAGEYGYCVRCGAEIPLGRLQVLPYSETCIRCADRRD